MAKSKQFVYLVQARDRFPCFCDLVTPNSDCVVLYWRDSPPPSTKITDPSWREIHYPDSTWNSGRNRLLREALSMGNYQYFIFMDDDVTLRDDRNERTDPFRLFEEFLARSVPALGVPSGTWHQIRYSEKNELSSLHFFDACISAFHRDALKVLLPYCERFDDISWWWSGAIVNTVSGHLYAGRNIQYNRVVYGNSMHEDYPRDKDDLSMEEPVRFIEQSFQDLWGPLPRYPLEGPIEYPVVERDVRIPTWADLETRVDPNHPYWEDKRKFWQKETGSWL